MEHIHKFSKVAQIPLSVQDVFIIKTIQEEEGISKNNRIIKISDNVAFMITANADFVHVFEYAVVNDSVIIFGKSDIYSENTLTSTKRINNYVEGACHVYGLKNSEPELIEISNYHFSKLHGIRTLVLDEYVELTHYDMDIKEGRYLIQLKDKSTTIVEGWYRNEKKHGKWSAFYNSGALKETKEYDGATETLTGHNICYDEQGNIISKKFFLKDKLHGEVKENNEISYYIFGNKVEKKVFDQYPFDKEKEIFGW